MSYRVIVTDEALSRIREHARFIAEEAQSPLNAVRWLTRVLDAADSLSEFPRRAPIAIESAFRPIELRSLIVDEFLLIFTIVGDHTVVVLTARHGRQLPRPAAELPDIDAASESADG